MIRKIFGSTIFSETIRHVVFGEFKYRYYTEIGRKIEKNLTGDFWMDYYSSLDHNLADKELLLERYEEIWDKISDINLEEC